MENIGLDARLVRGGAITRGSALVNSQYATLKKMIWQFDHRFGIDLHRLWQQAVEDNELLRQFSGGDPDIYGVLVLRALGLIREQEVKSKSLINLRPEGFEKDWHTAVLYMEKALKRTTSTSQDGFGAFAQKWLPYSTMMPVLAALLYRIDRDKLDNRAYRGVKKRTSAGSSARRH